MTNFINFQQPLTALCLTIVRSVSENNIGPLGAKHFADALVANQSLTSLEYAHPLLMTDLISCQQPLTLLIGCLSHHASNTCA